MTRTTPAVAQYITHTCRRTLCTHTHECRSVINVPTPCRRRCMLSVKIMWLLRVLSVYFVCGGCVNLHVLHGSVFSAVCRADVFRRADLSVRTDRGAKASRRHNQSDQLCQGHSARTVNGADNML